MQVHFSVYCYTKWQWYSSTIIKVHIVSNSYFFAGIQKEKWWSKTAVLSFLQQIPKVIAAPVTHCV